MNALPLQQSTPKTAMPKALPAAYCIVNEAGGYAYANVPKAACTSIKLAIAEHAGVTFADIQSGAPWRQPLSTLKDRTDLLRVSFVRHPGDRLISAWADWCQPPFPPWENYRRNRIYIALRGSSFPEFVHTVSQWGNRDGHTRPQAVTLTVDGEMVADRVYRFEALAEGWQELQEVLGLPDLPHCRKSCHRPWREYYTDELERLAKERYAVDLEMFGYEW